MKKVFLVLFASAAFSIGGCNSGSHEDKTGDSALLKEDVNDAMNSMNDSITMPADTMHLVPDSVK